MANDNGYDPTISGQIGRIQDSKEDMRKAINSYFPDDEQITEEETIDSYSAKIYDIPNNFNAELEGEFDKKNAANEVTEYSETYIKAIEQVNGVIHAEAGGLATSESPGLMLADDKAKLDNIEAGSQVNVQSDWNEADTTSDAYIKNKTHGITTVDVRRSGSYTHTNDITHIQHNGSTFELELGVKTQVNRGPQVYVTLTSPNTISIESVSSSWISTYPVSIIDFQKLDIKYLPDDVLNANIPQADWNESVPVLPSYINGRTHYIEYSSNKISSPGQYNLDDYNATYPVIICYNNNVYEVQEGTHTLSYGPPLSVSLSGNILTINASSYLDEYYKVKIATHVKKLNPIFIPNTIYSAGTGLDLDKTTFSLKTASATVLGGIKVGENLSIDDNGVLSAADTTYISMTADEATTGSSAVGRLIAANVLNQAIQNKLTWVNIQNIPTEFTPSDHTHTTADINTLQGYTSLNTAPTSPALAAQDTLNSALQKLEYKSTTTYNWLQSVTKEDTDEKINKWQEILDFLNATENQDDIFDLFVNVESDQNIGGNKTFTDSIYIKTQTDGPEITAGNDDNELKLKADSIEFCTIRTDTKESKERKELLYFGESGIQPAQNGVLNLGDQEHQFDTVYANSITGTASALALDDSIGSETKPVYFNADGTPSECDYYLNATVKSGTAGKLAYYSGANVIEAFTIPTSAADLYITGVNSSNKLCSGTRSDSGVRIKGGTTIYAGGGFYESSDERLKDFQEDIEVDLDTLAQLPKKYFTWKDGNNKNLQIGTSAQAVKELYPEIVGENADGTLSVAYDKLSVVALTAVDKLYEEVKALKSKNQELEDRISKLENLLLYGKEC